MIEIISDGEAKVLFRSEDSADLADWLIRSLQDKEKLKKNSENGRKLMATQYDWTEFGRKALEVYSGLGK